MVQDDKQAFGEPRRTPPGFEEVVQKIVEARSGGVTSGGHSLLIVINLKDKEERL